MHHGTSIGSLKAGTQQANVKESPPVVSPLINIVRKVRPDRTQQKTRATNVPDL